MRKLTAEMEDTPMYLRSQVDSCIEFLIKMGYVFWHDSIVDQDVALLDMHNMTAKGTFASAIAQCNEVMITELLYSKLLNPYRDDPVAIASILAIFLDDQTKLEDDPFESLADIVGFKHTNVLHIAVNKTEDVFEDMRRHNIVVPYQVSSKYVGPIFNWCTGDHFQSVCQNYNMFEGNFIRALQKLSNLLDELKSAFEIVQDHVWAQAIEKTKVCVVHDLLKTQSIYLTS
jgi:superfamily II RNA helicase